MHTDAKKARFLLEDGTSFSGVSPVKTTGASGGVIVNNSNVGFQEIMTDPANAGRIIIFTSPHAGNYGAAEKFSESSKCHALAAAVKCLSPFASNWQSEKTFGEFLDENGTACIEEIDTRQAARRIYEEGEMNGAITSADASGGFSPASIRPARISDVSVKKIRVINQNSPSPPIGILDFGVKNSLLAQLEQNGAKIILFPFDASADEILREKPGGLIISSGPEDEEQIAAAADTAGRLRGRMPMLGISSGCAALALCLGGKIKKLKSGHRGINYPVIPPGSGKGGITAQNHRLLIDEASRIEKAALTLINPDDGTAEAFESMDYKISGIHYEPEPPFRGGTHPDLKKFLLRAGENHA